MPWKLMKSYRISPRKWLSAFSAPDFAARRTIVRLARRNRTLQTILSLPFAGRLKKRRPKKRIRVWFGLLYGTNFIKADEILSDFSEEIIIRFFYRRKSPLPYNCTATWRFSTLLHLFYLSPIRVGWKRRPKKALYETARNMYSKSPEYYTRE